MCEHAESRSIVGTHAGIPVRPVGLMWLNRASLFGGREDDEAEHEMPGFPALDCRFPRCHMSAEELCHGNDESKEE